MNTLTYIALLLTTIAVNAAEAWRYIEIGKTNYGVHYTYNPSWCTIPATSPPGDPHFEAQIQIWRNMRKFDDGRYAIDAGSSKVGDSFAGTYVEKGCFEDRPNDLVIRALGLEGRTNAHARDLAAFAALSAITNTILAATNCYSTNMVIYMSDFSAVTNVVTPRSFSVDMEGEEVTVYDAKLWRNYQLFRNFETNGFKLKKYEAR